MNSLSPDMRSAIREAVEEAAKSGILKDALKQAVSELGIEQTLGAINHERRLHALESRADTNSIRVKEQRKLMDRITSGRAQLLYHIITILTVILTNYSHQKEESHAKPVAVDPTAP